MERRGGASLLLLSVFLGSSALVCAQTADPVTIDLPKNDSPKNDQAKNDQSISETQAAAPTGVTPIPLPPQVAPPIPADAPHMSSRTRLEIIRDFETQIFYARSVFPMGTKGLKLKNGVTSPSGTDLQAALALWGPAIKPGDPAHISFVQIKSDHIHFDLNGGPIHRKKWYEHVTISGANGNEIPLEGNQS